MQPLVHLVHTLFQLHYFSIFCPLCEWSMIIKRERFYVFFARIRKKYSIFSLAYAYLKFEALHCNYYHIYLEMQKICKKEIYLFYNLMMHISIQTSNQIDNITSFFKYWPHFPSPPTFLKLTSKSLVNVSFPVLLLKKCSLKSQLKIFRSTSTEIFTWKVDWCFNLIIHVFFLIWARAFF